MKCRICGLDVSAPSMGGKDVCSWCDCGVYRNGERWSGEETMSPALIRLRASDKVKVKYHGKDKNTYQS